MKRGGLQYVIRIGNFLTVKEFGKLVKIWQS